MRGDTRALGGFTTCFYTQKCESLETDTYLSVATFVRNALVKPQSENSGGFFFKENYLL